VLTLSKMRQSPDADICGACRTSGDNGRTTMPPPQNVRAKSLGSPDETRAFEHGYLDIAATDEFTAGRVTLEPG
jgi:hypothetical protein